MPSVDSHHPLVRRLAEEGMASDLFQAALDGAAHAAPAATSMRALIAYARRGHGAPADFAIEQAIRSDPAVARRYRNLMAGMATAFSPVALAAATEPVPGRVLGDWRLRVSAPEGLPPVLVLERQTPGPAPAAIEAVGAAGTIRLMLPAPVRQTIQLPLDSDIAELAAFHRLIADPLTAIFLL